MTSGKISGGSEEREDRGEPLRQTDHTASDPTSTHILLLPPRTGFRGRTWRRVQIHSRAGRILPRSARTRCRDSGSGARQGKPNGDFVLVIQMPGDSRSCMQAGVCVPHAPLTLRYVGLLHICGGLIRGEGEWGPYLLRNGLKQDRFGRSTTRGMVHEEEPVRFQCHP